MSKPNINMKTETTSVEITQQGIKLAKLAYGFHQAEKGAVDEVLKFATKNEVISYEVEEWFVEAGYARETARAYASNLRAVKRNKEVKQKVKNEEISFNQGLQQARAEKKESKQGWDIMLSALDTFVRIAIKFKMDLEWMKMTLEREYAKQNKS